MLREQIIGAKVNVPEIKQVNLTAATPLDKKDTKFISSDVLLAKDTLRLLQMYDDTEENNKWKKEIQDKLTAVEDKVDVLQQYELFKVVTELPTENIDPNSIYVVPKQNPTDQQDVCTEYIYRTDISNWEILGDVKVKVDMQGYAKLNGNNTFNGYNDFDQVSINRIELGAYGRIEQGVGDGNFSIGNVSASRIYTDNIEIQYDDNIQYYIRASWVKDGSKKAFMTDGSFGDMGSQEDFIFTLEDGSTVTKSIRVLSTTNS